MKGRTQAHELDVKFLIRLAVKHDIDHDRLEDAGDRG
jgi:methylglyoxal synthase